MPDHTDDDVNPLLADGYAAAAPQYWDAGWRGILPMPRGRKFPPPTNYTGYQALEPSYPDIQAWCDDHPDGNIALHLPHTIIGIDVDAYDGRTGAGTIAYAEHLWGDLPNTVRTTSRDDTASGIHLYRVPPGTQLATKIEFPDHSLGHIEIIQASHRYAVVWPSLHPTGARYRWQNSNGEAVDIPSPDDLPHLPKQWIDNLAPGSTINGLDTVDITQEIARLTGGTMDLAVTDRLARAIGDLQGNSSRHDATCKHVLALLRLSEQGHDGIQAAISHLGNAFVAAVINDGSRTEQQARSEYARMVYNERGHALIKATPTVTNVIDVTHLNELAKTTPVATEPESGVESEPEESPLAGDIDISDDEFWSSRQFLTAIYEQAHERLTSPWSALGCCIARVIATIPPWITLPPFIGGKGSLNTFVAIVGHSGQGKGSSENIGELLVPLPAGVGELPAGSGEGLAHAFVHRAGPKEKDLADENGIIRDRTACIFSIPEVDTLTAVGGRQGSTIMSKLRSAYSGEEVGFSYADPTKRLLVGKHRYRLALILGVQASRAGALLEDAGGGTPQRFVWLSANDSTTGSIPGRHHPPIEYTPNWGSYPRDIDVPDIAKKVIRESHIARVRGLGNALDGHALQTREKVMVALCALDGRTTPDEWDWMLAGRIMAESDKVRATITAELAAEATREAVTRGEQMGIARAVGDEAAAAWKANRVAKNIVRALVRKGGEMTGGEVLRSVSSRDRALASDALDLLVSEGRIAVDLVTTDGGEGHRVRLVGDGHE